MSAAAFPPHAAGKVLDDALAAGVGAVRALDHAMGGDQSMDDEELAALRIIRPLVEQITGSAEMVVIIADASSRHAASAARQQGEW